MSVTVIDFDENFVHILEKFPVSHFVKSLSAVLDLFPSHGWLKGHTDMMKLIEVLFATFLCERVKRRKEKTD
jgi:hypothetical protein